MGELTYMQNSRGMVTAGVLGDGDLVLVPIGGTNRFRPISGVSHTATETTFTVNGVEHTVPTTQIINRKPAGS